jgi:hypothetical protein
MPLKFGKLICIAAFIRPVVSQPSTSTLPSTLQNIIPTCAHSCLSDQITRDFPSTVCSNSNDLDCLCSHYGLDGYTLGERAFGCLFSSGCSAEARANASSVYTVCSGENNAVAPTEKTVVVTASSSAPTSTSSTTGGAKIPTTTMASSWLSAASTGSSPAATQATMDATPSDGPTMSSKSSIPLTEAQVAGIAIASIALVVLTVGIAGCLLFVRRRNKRLEEEESKLYFHHSRNASGSGSQFGGPLKDSRGAAGGVGIAPLLQGPVTPGGSTPPQVQDRTWPRYYPIMPGGDMGIGIAQTTNMPQPVPQAHTAQYQPPTQAQYEVSPTMTSPRHQHQSWPAAIPERQSTGVAPFNPTTPPQPPMASPPRTVASRRSRTSIQASPPRAPLQASISPQPTLTSPPRVTPPRPPRPSAEETPTQRGRQSVDRRTVLSQLTVFEEDASAHPGVVSPDETQLPQRPQLEDPSRSNSDFSNDYSNNVMPMPKQRTAPGRQRGQRPHMLRIQIPSYPSGSSSSIRESELPAKRLPPTQEQQAQTSSPLRKSPQKSAMASPKSRASPKPRKKASFTIAQISPSDSPLKHPSPRSDPSSTLRSSGIFPTRVHEIKPKPEQQRKSRPGSSARPHRKRQPELVRDSFASYTSFESLGSDDDPTPPEEEDKQLSAVSESSPISGLKYPKIPRASAQLVSRTPPSPKRRAGPKETASPKQLTPTPSPKHPQKSKAVAHGVENHLWRTELGASRPSPPRPSTPPPRQTAPASKLATPQGQSHGPNVPPTGYFHPNTPQYGQPRAQTVSWASGQEAMFAQFNPASPFGPMPKLTPTRRGDDLYLKVG